MFWRGAAVVYLALLAALLAVTVYFARPSQPPVPREAERAQHEQAKSAEHSGATADHERGSKGNPLIVRAAPYFESDADKEHDRKEKEDKALYDKVLAIATFALAVFTAFLFAATCWIVVSAAKDSRRQLRAHVLASSGTLGDWNLEPYQTKEGFQAAIALKNFGKTPAFDVCVIGGMCIRPLNDALPELRQLIYDDAHRSRQTYGPGFERHKVEGLHDETTVGKTRAPTEVDRKLLDQPDNEHAVYVYGEIQYVDEFKAKRWSTYCFILNRRILKFRKRGPTDEIIGLAAFRAWNQTGIQCKDQKPPFCKDSKWLGPGHGATPLSAKTS